MNDIFYFELMQDHTGKPVDDHKEGQNMRAYSKSTPIVIYCKNLILNMGQFLTVDMRVFIL